VPPRGLPRAQGIYEGHTAMAGERDGRRTSGEGEEEGSVRAYLVTVVLHACDLDLGKDRRFCDG
jgi:hypothetical protein